MGATASVSQRGLSYLASPAESNETKSNNSSNRKPRKLFYLNPLLLYENLFYFIFYLQLTTGLKYQKDGNSRSRGREADGSSISRVALSHLSTTLRNSKDPNSIQRRASLERDGNSAIRRGMASSDDYDYDDTSDSRKQKQIQAQAMAIHGAATKPAGPSGAAVGFIPTGILRPIEEEIMTPHGKYSTVQLWVLVICRNQ